MVRDFAVGVCALSRSWRDRTGDVGGGIRGGKDRSSRAPARAPAKIGGPSRGRAMMQCFHSATQSRLNCNAAFRKVPHRHHHPSKFLDNFADRMSPPRKSSSVNIQFFQRNYI